MSYGIRVLDAAGNVLIDTSTSTVTVIDTFDVSSGTTGSKSYTDFDGSQDFAFTYSKSDSGYILPKVTWSGNTVQWDYTNTTVAGLVAGIMVCRKR